ncbi:MAG: 2OG-Fe(II) oxygenase, partial [Candidatus Rokuibacteriota bacterium]
MDASSIATRLAGLDWEAVERALWDQGYAKTPALLTADECEALIGLYADEARFRSRVDMGRHRFGEGDYKYLARPLPPLVESLRNAAYPRLASLANAWEEALGSDTRYPDDLDGLLALCRQHGQTKPTPLLLHYEAGGYNCLH